ncbi:DUF1223 domain-containing protein [Variovorax sp. PCZ-1]|uniref:DUF1223 domain-containing protein n=1 Tax=Variovorax sp. PCZ-1 TaxID=2835533 RepID=UPI001BCD3172|nr:DUF1223 domain-containing protein [Variovorax sp. PCZ-1]MBS7806856.1 DUF1223 domain-containing protein [Variovorax sp. PCZ-1]
MSHLTFTPHLIALCAVCMPAISAFSMENCSAKSAATLTPVIELYTSEGCSSCPPADTWLSGFKAAQKEGKVVAQAFHVNYWDYIGWKDRFAAPAYTQRQRELSARTSLNSIYTPQIAKNGLTVRNVGQAAAMLESPQVAQASINLKQIEPNRFEARIEAMLGTVWSAYFTVTEHDHVSRVTAGENKGETLKNDFVVRQYVPLGQFTGEQTLKFSSLAPTLTAGKAHPRQINLVVTDNKTGKTMQALSLDC